MNRQKTASLSERQRFLRFLLVGGMAAAINIASRVLLNTVMSYEAAIPVAYLIGMVVAYALNRAFVFAPSGRTVRDEGMRFLFINMLAAAQVWIVSVALMRFVFPTVGFVFYADTVAHVIGVLSPVFTSYAGHKYVSFRAKENECARP